MMKAWTGFRSVSGEAVSTGHWGCGAFGGDKNIKSLVQVLAASLAGVKKLDFYCFDDQEFHDDFTEAMNKMKDKTVGWVWDQIMNFRNNREEHNAGNNVLQFIKGAP